MTTIPVTRADAHLLRALASLASVQPDRARAAHLVARAEAFAARIEAATVREIQRVEGEATCEDHAHAQEAGG
jgi:hypothetical protein